MVSAPAKPQTDKAMKVLANARGLLAHHPDPRVQRAWLLLGTVQEKLRNG